MGNTAQNMNGHVRAFKIDWMRKNANKWQIKAMDAGSNKYGNCEICFHPVSITYRASSVSRGYCSFGHESCIEKRIRATGGEIQ